MYIEDDMIVLANEAKVNSMGLWNRYGTIIMGASSLRTGERSVGGTVLSVSQVILFIAKKRETLNKG